MNDTRFVTPLGNDGMYMDKEKCINCGVCMGYCPVNSIYAEGEEILISYDYCKGCGICAAECPKQAINMEQEVK